MGTVRVVADDEFETGFVDNGDDEIEHDPAADQELIAAFAGAREREKSEVAAVEVPRYQIAQRDSDGQFVRDEHGHIEHGSLALYFRYQSPKAIEELRAKHTHPVTRRDGGRRFVEDKLDDFAFSQALTYRALVPWCRRLYFDDQRLWSDAIARDAVRTGEQFLAARLNLGELQRCVEAIQTLAGLGDDLAERVGKG